ncbi:tyrosine-type recombinase/integrase [Bacillus kwashiorkori]|uniref:tyrosine-type recombinase/integrase n=1 Tax=Bacillus kwashiorkori TaxID=1522318 RepID=UPI000781DB6A|nr:tyrosine-type recombinase/integrase [Bacillus kwashiorkori]
MRVEKVRDKDGKVINYILVGDDFQEVKVVSDFIAYLRVKNYSPNTLKNYIYDLRYYFEYLEVIQKSHKEIRPKDLVDFISYLKEKPARGKPSNVITIQDIAKGHKKTGTLSASTINRILACISSFYDWVMLNDDGYEGNPLPYVLDYKTGPITDSFKGFLSFVNKGNQAKSRFLKVKAPKQLPRPVSTDKTKLILQSLKTYRDKAILLLSLQGGLRIGEILGITFEDINFRKREITVRFREDNPNGSRVKSSKDRVVQLYEQEALNCLNDYILYERPDSDSEYIFLSGKGKTKGLPLSYQGINTIFNYHCKKLGLKVEGKGTELTLHAFRHTHATKMYEGGMSLLSLQKRLGHSSPQSTQIYTKVSDNQVKEEYKRVIDTNSETE